MNKAEQLFEKLALPAIHKGVIFGSGALATTYLAARAISKPSRTQLKKEVEDELNTIPVIDPSSSTVKVKPGILNPLTKRVEMNLRKTPSESISSKDKSPWGYGTVDFTISANPISREAIYDSIYLKDKYKGKGIGKATLKMVENIAKKQKRKKLSLMAEGEGKYFWSRVSGMEPVRDDMVGLRKRYKKWAKKNNQEENVIKSVKDYPKEFLLSDESGDDLLGFIHYTKKLV